MIDSNQFRTAMSRLGAAVNIITTDGEAGRHGMTASAVCSVSDEPAALLVCINRVSRMNAVIERNGKLCVNVLCGDHEELSGLFASKKLTMDERFDRGEWELLTSGLPALVGALCSLGCHVDAIHQVGTHSVFVCHVEDIRMDGEGDGLVYFDRNYHRIAQSMPA